MWTCSKCGRIFRKTSQSHSCKKVPLSQHFKNKKTAEKIFNLLVKKIRKNIGKSKIISIPCCIHLFGIYDYLAALPKKDKLEIRFSLDRILDSKRVKQAVPISSKSYKNCIDIKRTDEIDKEILEWITESYNLQIFI